MNVRGSRMERIKGHLRREEGAIMVIFAMFVGLVLLSFSLVMYDLGILVSMRREAQVVADMCSSFGARQLDKSKASSENPQVGFVSDLEARVKGHLSSVVETRYGKDQPLYTFTNVKVSSYPLVGRMIPLSQAKSNPSSCYVEVSFDVEVRKEATLLLGDFIPQRRIRVSSKATLSFGE